MTTGHRQNILVVLGREWRDGRFYGEPAKCLKDQINNTVIISTPDASNLKGEHMLDLMALTYSGPHLFLVRLEEGKQRERELSKWAEVFGEDISDNMIYITDGHYDDSRFPGKCINIKEDVIKQCEDIISKDNHSRYSFGEFLNRRRKQIEDKMAPKTDTQHSSRDPAPGGQPKSPQLTLVLLGEPGTGKSASGNTILGDTLFPSEPSSMPVTTECEMQTGSVYGTKVTVIDTPHFFDDSLQEKSTDIESFRKLCKGGLCVYLLVIQIGRFTEGERDILERLEKALDPRIRDRAIILFTRGDDLRSNIDEFVRNTNPFLKKLIMKCGERYQVISNTTSHKGQAEKQVKELMGKIADLVQKTDKVKVVPQYDAKRSGCV